MKDFLNEEEYISYKLAIVNSRLAAQSGALSSIPSSTMALGVSSAAFFLAMTAYAGEEMVFGSPGLAIAIALLFAVLVMPLISFFIGLRTLKKLAREKVELDGQLQRLKSACST